MSKKYNDDGIPLVSMRSESFPKDGDIRNAMITKADVTLVRHYYNLISLSLAFQADAICGMFMPTYNSTGCIGHVIRGVFNTVLGEWDKGDDSLAFSSLKGRPIRIVSTGMVCVGIGNFMSDKWLLEQNVNAYVGNGVVDEV